MRRFIRIGRDDIVNLSKVEHIFSDDLGRCIIRYDNGRGILIKDVSLEQLVKILKSEFR
jgi:DNA-binding LytR/AlgR family response regulator